MLVTSFAPTLALEHAFVAMLNDFDALDPKHGEHYAPARLDFAAYVRGLEDQEAGINLPQGHVPCTHRWLVTSDSTIVGVTRVRHSIATPFLAAHAGHIGYDVALGEAHRIGIIRVLVFTAQDNATSRAIIERAGGLLESVAYSDYWGEQECKYWIPVHQVAERLV
jgi:predicted acetyltransferase